MSTYNHSPISTGAAANAGVVNTPIGQLDAALGQLSALATANRTSLVAAINELRGQTVSWGANVTSGQLKAWTESGAYEITAVTYHGTYTNVVSSGTVKWPDASAGVFTVTTINASWEAIDAYTITHTVSGLTVTQAAVTRNSDGNVTVKPALTVA